MEYPSEWQANILEEQPTPLIDDEAILKRIAFSSSPVLVYLDIWMAKGRSFANWMNWYKETRLVDQMTIKSNATVSGKPAVTFLQEHKRDLMLTYFSDGNYVYRLMNWMTGMTTDLNAYWHMLESFNLPGTSTSASVEIPTIARHDGKLSAQKHLDRMVNTCCYTAAYNPFPCCNDGNCTWWCYYKYPGLPFSGNAGTWWGQVNDHSAWTQSSQPVTGGMSIACWGGSPGHVAHAANWSGSGNVTITEMSWCQPCDGTRAIAASSPSQGWTYSYV
ncbi:MAG: CHAP domain-containing protein [Anaerolineaceae bacterium]|nr:CHAP domain-containing protein [Anaerolineaceae bacterium]